MEYKETVKKVIAEVCRLLPGVVFIFSGTVKAVDPMGGAIKIGDYLTSFGLDKLQPFTVLISFNLSALEFMLGVCMLLGVYRRYYDLLDLADDVFHDAADAVSGDLQSRIGLRLLRGCLGDQ